MFVRWESLLASEDEEHRLPGYRDAAVVRRFDVPEAMDIRFYEVHAKSLLNRVPKSSRMPFPWTINPYRGCTHACTWCLTGETPILMADGRTKPLADVREGDTIYGTVREGAYRRYVPTPAQAHWESRKDAYRVTLEDGTELVASGDHRFLTKRGWKHVTGAMSGPLQRPYLTSNDKLMGVGALGSPPQHSSEYRRGYLCGMIRGDGHLGSYTYDRRARGVETVHRFRLALVDFEALHRTRDYLSEESIPTSEFAFRAADARGQAMNGIRAQAAATVDAIRELIEWPRCTGDDWCKGFLAGVFDAEGCHSGYLRIANTDPLILDWIEYALRRLGFPYVRERARPSNGLVNIRVTGGLLQILRFFQMVDPAITRKRTIDGIAIKSKAKLKVVEIEPLGQMDLYDITTGTGDFIANGVVSHNCFARPTHKFLDFDAGRDFEREIVVKVNAPERARAELSKPSWKHEHVAMGTNTDPYQWVEGRYKLMPGIWEALRDTATPCSVLTKSPLVLRDLDLLKQIAKVTSVSASFSVPTLDEKVWRQTEPHTPHPRARLEALAEVRKAGIPSSVLIAPLMPGVNDSPKQLEPLLEMAAEAGATNVVPVALHLRGEVKGLWFDWLREYRPDLVSRYEHLYPRGAYMAPGDRKRTTEYARKHRRSRGARSGPVPSRSYAPHRNDPAPFVDDESCAPARQPGVSQGSLF
jgi:DNA repair photolyase